MAAVLRPGFGSSSLEAVEESASVACDDELTLVVDAGSEDDFPVSVTTGEVVDCETLGAPEPAMAVGVTVTVDWNVVVGIY
jgi:hypothetical protein